MGCHFLLQRPPILDHNYSFVLIDRILLSGNDKILFVSVTLGTIVGSCPTLLKPHELWPIRFLCHGVSQDPGKNTGVGHLFLLQGFFLTQGSNPRLLHWQAGSFPLSCQGSMSADSMGQGRSHQHTEKQDGALFTSSLSSQG